MVNTVTVFALSAACGLAVIIGSLLGMAWVEKRMISDARVARSRSYAPAQAVLELRCSDDRQPPQPVVIEGDAVEAVQRAPRTRKVRVTAMSAVLAATALSCAALSVGDRSVRSTSAVDRFRRATRMSLPTTRTLPSPRTGTSVAAKPDAVNPDS